MITKHKLLLTIIFFLSLGFIKPQQIFAGWTWEGNVYICQDSFDNCKEKRLQVGDPEAISDTFFPVEKGAQILQINKGSCSVSKTDCNQNDTCDFISIIDNLGGWKIENYADHSCCIEGQENCFASFLHPIYDQAPPGAKNPEEGFWWMSRRILSDDKDPACAACNNDTCDGDGDGVWDCTGPCKKYTDQNETIETDFIWVEPQGAAPTANFSGKCDPAVQTWDAGTSFSFKLDNVSPTGETLESSTLFLTFLEGDGLNDSFEKNIMSFLGTPKWNEDLGNNQWVRSYPLITHTKNTESLDDNQIVFNINASTTIQNQGGSTKTLANLMSEVESILGTINDNPGPFQTKYENLQVTDPYTFSFGANLLLTGRKQLNWAGNGVLVDLRPNVCAEPPTNTPTPTSIPDAPQCHLIEMLDEAGSPLNTEESLEIGQTVYFNCFSDKDLADNYHFAFRTANEDCQTLAATTHHNQGQNNGYRYTVNRSGRFAVQCAVCDSQNNCDWEGVPYIPACHTAY